MNFRNSKPHIGGYSNITARWNGWCNSRFNQHFTLCRYYYRIICSQVVARWPFSSSNLVASNCNMVCVFLQFPCTPSSQLVYNIYDFHGFLLFYIVLCIYHLIYFIFIHIYTLCRRFLLIYFFFSPLWICYPQIVFIPFPKYLDVIATDMLDCILPSSRLLRSYSEGRNITFPTCTQP